MDNIARPGKGPVRKFFSSLGRGILILMFIGIIAGSIVVSVLALYIFNSLDGAPSVDLKDINQNLSNTSYIYANDKAGEPVMVHELYSGKNREWIPYSKIPKDVVTVTIAAEDKRFNEHQGVDWLRTVRSTLDFFTGGRTQGGSTITQQVIKNLTLNDEVTPERKVQEIFTALKMEKNYTKDEIMEAYLNIAFFSNHCYGIQSAAKLYFAKDVSELNIAEIATIIAVTNAPTRYNPLRESINEKNGWGTGLEENKKRRTYIIDEMLDLGKLTQADHDKWVNFDVKLAERKVVATADDNITAITSWFNDQVIQDVQDDLATEKGYTSSYASQMIYNGGYRIYSTMDIDLQKSMEDSYADPKTFPAVSNKVYPETAAIMIAPDGSVKGMIGGNTKDKNRIFNRATMAVRHPGSTMKPISAYLNAFEQDLITWSTTIVDEPMTLTENGKTFDWPSNYTETYTRAPMTIQHAVQQSINTVPARLVSIMTPQVCYKTLKNKFQISTLSPMDEFSKSSMALGGMTYGMTPLELVGCYQIFLTGGKYVKPYTYTKVTDMDGNIILEKDTTQVRVVSEETATVLNRLLQTVTSSGTGAAANLKSTIGMPTAGKTGSSTGTKWVNGAEIEINNPDLWFIGMTPYYVGGVWMGYDVKEEIRYSSYPTPKLWKNIMTPIVKDLPIKDFTYSDKVKSMSYCLDSGDLATENCPRTASGWYKDTYIPSTCLLHRTGAIALPEEATGDTADPADSANQPGTTTTPDKPKVIKKNDNSAADTPPDTADGAADGGTIGSGDFWDHFFN